MTAWDNVVVPLTLKDCAHAAQFHQMAFYKDWTEKDFQDFLNDPLVFGLKIQRDGAFSGYILWREVKDEAEILTLVIAPSFQRRGMGNFLLKALFEQLKTRHISKLFLEVAEDNEAAKEFYLKNRFILLRKIPEYYARSENRFVDGLSFFKVIE